MLRARFAAIVVPLIPLVSGCGAGCSDVAVSDTVRVRLEMPGEITAEVTDASGRVIGSTSAPFDFEDYTAEGDCESALSQVITVERARVLEGDDR